MSVQAGIDMLSGGGDNSNSGDPNDTDYRDAVGSTDTGTEESQQQTDQSGGHPAWDDVIKYVNPDGLDFVRQKLKEWDSGVNRRFEEVQSRYKPFEPFLEYQPQTLEQAITLFNVFNGDPRRLYDQMAQHFGFNRGQGPDDNLDVGEFADDEEEQNVPDITQHPMFQQLATQQQMIQQHLAAQMQAQEEAETDAWLDGEMSRLSEANPGIEIDWDYVLNKAVAIADRTGNSDTALEHAVTDYVGLVTKMRAPSAPRILPTSGGMPVNSNEELKKALSDDSTRRKLGVEMLERLRLES